MTYSMTALAEFARLESPGVWQKAPDAQRRDVIVSFGDATLVLCDMAERPVAHWSLAAIKRIGGSADRAVFSPDPEGAERLELTEPLMIDAIEKVGRSLLRQGPHPGALRGVIAGALILGLGALGVFWLPGALKQQAHAALPQSSLRAIDTALTQELSTITGPACQSPRGDRALASLAAKIGHDGPILVVPEALPAPLSMPGGTLVLDMARLDRAQEPSEAAGALIAAKASVPSQLGWLLDHAGVMGTLHLMTQGEMRHEDLNKAARAMATDPLLAAPQDIADGFERAALPASPWAQTAGSTGIAVMQLIDEDAAQTAEILPDRDWVALQTICGF